jgi:hypothetical protein
MGLGPDAVAVMAENHTPDWARRKSDEEYPKCLDRTEQRIVSGKAELFQKQGNKQQGPSLCKAGGHPTRSENYVLLSTEAGMEQDDA